ncbi:MAG: general secretion pathway protein GspK [Candidatus Omnitrophica bacterium]|nr:general secretion pathway protein GspK [Candidatus Omnitrophota bacterium]
MNFHSEKMKETMQGSVLISVIWILSVLVIFTVAINRQASQSLMMGKWMKERIMARIFANAGVERALFEIQNDGFLTFDALNESWGNNPEAFQEISMGEEGYFSVVCPLSDAVSEEDFRYGICDESGRINVNTASEQVLYNLLFLVDETMAERRAQAIAQSIIDWRDPDDAVMEHGAEGMFYNALDEPYEPRNAPLEVPEELLMIRGIDASLYQKLEPHVTVFTEEKINFNSASPIVLQALGMSPELAMKIVTFRKGEDGIEGTEDDGVFQIVEGITPALSASVSFSPEEFAEIANIIAQEIVTVKSNAFRIRSFGRLIRNDTVIETGIVCVVERTGKVLYWRETGG